MVPLPGIFVAGTDTGVGKTRVACAIAATLRAQGKMVGVLKPLATGAVREGDSWRCTDAEALIEAAGGAIPVGRVAPLVFEEPLAPSVAARRAGAPLHARDVLRALHEALGWWRERAEALVIEGVGGLLSPVAEDMTVADIAVALDYPVVIVARRALGTLAHTLAAVEGARGRGLRVAGVVLSAAEPDAGTAAEATNAEELARRLEGIPILADVPFQADPGAFAIAVGSVDWYDRMDGPRDAGRLEGDLGLRGGESGP